MSRKSVYLACGLALLISGVVAVAGWREVRVRGDEREQLVAQGRRIFAKGLGSAGRPVRARLHGSEISGSAVACAGCHGRDGAGSREGAVTTPDIRSRALSLRYSKRALGRALLEGRNEAGRELSPVMPRFELEPNDARALFAYLSTLGEVAETGVFADRIRIGAVLPRLGPLAGMSATARGVLEARIGEVNAQGGIFGRALELVVGESRESLVSEKVFALVSSWQLALPPDELKESDLPLIGPLGIGGVRTENADDTPTFHLYPGLDTQARIAMRHAVNRQPARPVAIIYSATEEGRSWVSGARYEAEQAGVTGRLHSFALAEAESTQATRLLTKLRRAGVGTILYAGPAEELRKIAQKLTALTENLPTIIAPSTLLGRYAIRISFVYPGFIAQVTDKNSGEYERFTRQHNPERRHPAFAASAYVSVQLLVEALKRAGADPTRDRLVGALEGLREFSTGVVPPLGFGPGVRLGLRGSRIVEYQPVVDSFREATQWIELANN